MRSNGAVGAIEHPEICHELGHAVGLRHCENPCCVMCFSNSLAEADAKGEELCASCMRRVRAA
ncbi:MAG: hypothetical protein ABSG18_21645 [Steroidobacteraceae bacterium]